MYHFPRTACLLVAPSVPSPEIILTVNLSEALNGSLPSQRPPTGRLPRTQTPCSGISPAPGGHFIKLSTLLFWGSEVTWPSPTMQTLWQGCSSRIKEVINQLTRLLRTILALHWGGKQCSHSRRWEEPSRAEPSGQAVSTLQQLATWDQNNSTVQPLLQQVKIFQVTSMHLMQREKWVKSVHYSYFSSQCVCVCIELLILM